MNQKILGKLKIRKKKNLGTKIFSKNWVRIYFFRKNGLGKGVGNNPDPLNLKSKSPKEKWKIKKKWKCENNRERVNVLIFFAEILSLEFRAWTHDQFGFELVNNCCKLKRAYLTTNSKGAAILHFCFWFRFLLFFSEKK